MYYSVDELRLVYRDFYKDEEDNILSIICSVLKHDFEEDIKDLNDEDLGNLIFEIYDRNFNKKSYYFDDVIKNVIEKENLKELIDKNK